MRIGGDSVWYGEHFAVFIDVKVRTSYRALTAAKIQLDIKKAVVIFRRQMLRDPKPRLLTPKAYSKRCDLAMLPMLLESPEGPSVADAKADTQDPSDVADAGRDAAPDAVADASVDTGESRQR